MTQNQDFDKMESIRQGVPPRAAKSPEGLILEAFVIELIQTRTKPELETTEEEGYYEAPVHFRQN